MSKGQSAGSGQADGWQSTHGAALGLHAVGAPCPVPAMRGASAFAGGLLTLCSGHRRGACSPRIAVRAALAHPESDPGPSLQGRGCPILRWLPLTAGPRC